MQETIQVVGLGWSNFVREVAQKQRQGYKIVPESGHKLGLKRFICEMVEGEFKLDPDGDDSIPMNYSLLGESARTIVGKIAQMQEQGMVLVEDSGVNLAANVLRAKYVGSYEAPSVPETPPEDVQETETLDEGQPTGEEENSSEEVTEPSTEKEIQEDAPEEEKSLPNGDSNSEETETEAPEEEEIPVVEYTQETLEEMDFPELRELGKEKFGVTGRSKAGVIEDILKAQAEQSE